MKDYCSWRVLCVGAVLLTTLSSGAWSEEDPADQKRIDDRELIISVQGEMVGGDILALSVEPGGSATRAIRIYSEPSHTLLALILDKEFESSGVGQAWKSSETLHEKALAQVITKLPEGQPRLHIQGRPKTDDRIAAHIYGSWPDGASEERLIADALVGSGNFGFSSFLRLEGGDTAALQIEHCCSGGECKKQKCKTCSGFQFTCCLLPNCCWIECGWVSGCTCAECNC